MAGLTKGGLSLLLHRSTSWAKDSVQEVYLWSHPKISSRRFSKWDEGGKEAYARCISATVGDWSLILLRKSGRHSAEHAAELWHLRGEGTGVVIQQLPSVISWGWLGQYITPWLQINRMGSSGQRKLSGKRNHRYWWLEVVKSKSSISYSCGSQTESFHWKSGQPNLSQCGVLFIMPAASPCLILPHP